VYVGAVTDEALNRMLDLSASDVASHHVVLDTPAEGAVLPKDTPASFSFHPVSASGRLLDRPRHERFAGARPRARGPLLQLWGSLQLEGVAFAHGTPFNGTAYLLDFIDASSQIELRVFTDQTSYTPDAASWARLAAAPKPLSLVVTSAIFEENEIAVDDGPFVGGTVHFDIE